MTNALNGAPSVHANGVPSGPSGTRAGLDSQQPAKVPTLLRADHDKLEALRYGLLRTLNAGDRDGVVAAIADLRARVLAHIEWEERELFAQYALYAPQDASELLLDHSRIREALSEFDVAVDLDLVRADAIDAFLTTLQQHAERENTGLYRWAAELRWA